MRRIAAADVRERQENTQSQLGIEPDGMVIWGKSMKGVLAVAFLMICFAQLGFAQCEDESCGLVIRGTVIDLRVAHQKDSVSFDVSLDVEFKNEGTKPIILFTNEFPDGYWLGGWSLFKNSDDKEVIFGDGYWQSVMGSPSYKRMAEELDTKSPPDGLTKTLQPDDSWKFKDEFRISFEAEEHTRIPEHKTWKEMRAFPSKLWLRISYELNPWNVEYFKPDLIRKLRKRWKNYGIVLVENDKEGRFNHLIMTSEPMLIDFSQAEEKAEN